MSQINFYAGDLFSEQCSARSHDARIIDVPSHLMSASVSILDESMMSRYFIEKCITDDYGILSTIEAQLGSVQDARIQSRRKRDITVTLLIH
jgi:hypothetical protein